MSTVWLFLLLAELFCPAFGEAPDAAASGIAGRVGIVASSPDAGIGETSAEISLSNGGHPAGGDEKVVCRDECLCHPFLPARIAAIDVKTAAALTAKILFEHEDDIANPLSPPFEPPRRS